MTEPALELKRIVEAGMHAPSGDNLQPWKITASHDVIELHADPMEVHSIYDYKRHGSLVALGACIENMALMAASLGKKVDTELFPSDDDPNYIARLRFTGEPSAEERAEAERLAALIEKRETNRNRYRKGVPLTGRQREALRTVPTALGLAGEVHIVEEKEARDELAWLLSRNDKLIFLNRALHDGLYKYIRWTPRQVEETRTGLDIRTLEFPWYDRLAMRTLTPWFLTHFLNALVGVAGIIGWKTARIYRTASAICAITMPGNSEHDFINGGRITERLWLESTAMGLSIHPAFGFALLGECMRAGDTALFTEHHTAIIKDSFSRILEIFNIHPDDRTIVMLYRTGVAEKRPSARSVRKFPEKVVTYEEHD